MTLKAGILGHVLVVLEVQNARSAAVSPADPSGRFASAPVASLFPAVSVTQIPEIRWRAAMLISPICFIISRGFARVIGLPAAVFSIPK